MTSCLLRAGTILETCTFSKPVCNNKSKLPSFHVSLQKVGDGMIDSIIGDNIPVLTEQEKFNETITSSVKRIESSLTGESQY